jgi:hypothetical protein
MRHFNAGHIFFLGHHNTWHYDIKHKLHSAQTTLSIKDSYVMRSISDTQHKRHRITMLCLNAKCRVLVLLLCWVSSWVTHKCLPGTNALAYCDRVSMTTKKVLKPANRFLFILLGPPVSLAPFNSNHSLSL